MASLRQLHSLRRALPHFACACTAMLASACHPPSAQRFEVGFSGPWTTQTSRDLTAVGSGGHPARSASVAKSSSAAGQAIDLQHAIELALARHPDISRAKAEVARSRGDVMVAEAAWYPKIAYNSSLGQSTTAASSADASSMRVGLEANQLLYDFGRADGQIAANRSTEQQRVAELKDAAEKVALGASEAYLELARAQSLATVADRYLAALVNLRTKIELRASSGAANQSDFYVAQTRIQSAHGERIRARTRFLASQARLYRLTGATIARTADPAPRISTLAKLVSGSDLADGIGIQAAEKAAEAARAKLRIAHAAHYPSIGLRANHTTPLGGQDLASTSMVNVTFTGDLYTGGATAGRIAAAKSELEAAERSADLARHNSATEVAVAEAEYAGARERSSAYASQLENAHSARRTSLAEYEIGKRTLTEVLNAEQEIFRAETDRINALGDAQLAIVRAAAARHLLIENQHLR